jgi:cytochrome c peroxidase
MLFDSVYGCDTFKNVDLAYDKIAEAIVAYEQSKEVCKFSSKFDRYLKGREKLSTKEKRGYALFTGKAHCDRCHINEAAPNSGGPLFTDFSFENVGTPKNKKNPYYRMPYNTDGLKFVDKGLGASANIHDSKYDGFMKVPTLRNIEITGPYMHNGVFGSLKQVVHFYNTSKTGDWPAPEVNNDIYSDIGNLGLTDKEENDIVAFLETLTDK